MGLSSVQIQLPFRVRTADPFCQHNTCCVRHSFFSQLPAIPATGATSSKINMHFFILQLKDSNSTFIFMETIHKSMQAFGKSFHDQDQNRWAILEFCFRTFESEFS